MRNSNEEYNGWTNYETWLVNLWMGQSDYWNDMVADVVKGSDSDTPVLDIADYLEQSHDNEYLDLVGNSGVFSDLIGAALSRVNWKEIAEHYFEELQNV